jgi:hypothetical protein
LGTGCNGSRRIHLIAHQECLAGFHSAYVEIHAARMTISPVGEALKGSVARLKCGLHGAANRTGGRAEQGHQGIGRWDHHRLAPGDQRIHLKANHQLGAGAGQIISGSEAQMVSAFRKVGRPLESCCHIEILHQDKGGGSGVLDFPFVG